MKFNEQRQAPQSRGWERGLILAARTLAISLCIGYGSGGFMSSAFADGLYEVEVPVDGRGPDSEIAGLTAAMSEVLTRLTGDPGFARTKKAEPLLNDPHKYVGQYGFHAGTQGALTLKAQFDEKALDAALRQAGVKVNSQQLPSLLVWLVSPAEQGAWQFVGADDSEGYGAELKAAASKRRLPVILPLLDLEDETHIKPDDVIQSGYGKLASASSRYGAKAILSGTIAAKTEGVYESKLDLLLANGQAIPFSQQGPDARRLLDGAVDWAADYLQKNRLPGRPELTTVELVVEGVDNLDQFMRVLRYLRARDQVENVMVKTLEPSRVTFAAKPVSSYERMQESLPDGTTLEATSLTSPNYRLVPGTGGPG